MSHYKNLVIKTSSRNILTLGRRSKNEEEIEAKKQAWSKSKVLFVKTYNLELLKPLEV